MAELLGPGVALIDGATLIGVRVTPICGFSVGVCERGGGSSRVNTGDSSADGGGGGGGAGGGGGGTTGSVGGTLLGDN